MFGSPTPHRPRSLAHAAYAWRDAELLVHVCWDAFLVADRVSRPHAFAAYVAALDDEAAAASALAHAHADLAEAA